LIGPYALIVEGFFEEVLARVPLEGLHKRLSAFIERKLGSPEG
jgi:hypothetical protein